MNEVLNWTDSQFDVSNAKGIFTVDFYERGGKKIEILSRVYQTSPPKYILQYSLH
jgi:hypothetical protein